MLKVQEYLGFSVGYGCSGRVQRHLGRHPISYLGMFDCFGGVVAQGPMLLDVPRYLGASIAIMSANSR